MVMRMPLMSASYLAILLEEGKWRQTMYLMHTLRGETETSPMLAPFFISDPSKYIIYNTLGVCHQLSNGFELKHGMLSGDEGVKIKSIRVSSNLNLDNAPLLTYRSLLRLCKSKAKHAHSM